MKEILFSGVVHPEREKVFISESTQYLEDQDGKEIGTLKVEISYSQISAHLNTNRSEIDLNTWRNSVQPRIEVLIDAYGFLIASGFQVEIIKAYDINSKKDHVFGVTIDALPCCQSSEELLEKYSQITSLLKGFEGVFFQRCLADLRQAIKNPFDSSLHCFRAIESIRQIYCKRLDIDPENKKSQSWQALRSDLNIEEEVIKNNIQKHSKIIRHGGLAPFTTEERTNMLKTTWVIVHKFISKYGEK